MVGDEKFQDLLQIRAGNSLVFVIDTTGSMGKDIAAVMNKTKEIVRETQGTPNAPYNYILVTFNDPGTIDSLFSKGIVFSFLFSLEGRPMY